MPMLTASEMPRLAHSVDLPAERVSIDVHGWPYTSSVFRGKTYRVYTGPDWVDHALVEQTIRLHKCREGVA